MALSTEKIAMHLAVRYKGNFCGLHTHTLIWFLCTKINFNETKSTGT